MPEGHLVTAEAGEKRPQPHLLLHLRQEALPSLAVQVWEGVVDQVRGQLGEGKTTFHG